MSYPAPSVIVNLHKQARDPNRKSRIQTTSFIWSFRKKINMGLVIRRVEVFSIPAARKIYFSTGTAWALHSGREVVITL